jgi:isocitrate dehydrogenase (NAD+)
MKMVDGLFMEEALKVADKYPEILCEVENVDTVCYKLAKDPTSLDVMCMPNLYGDIISDLCSGLIG